MNIDHSHSIALTVFILISLISCSKSNPGKGMEDSSKHTETISLATAIERMEEMIDEISFQTRSMSSPHYSWSDIIVLGNKSLGTNTRSEGGLEIPDTLLYIVNFNNNEGFAVLAGDKRISSPVLCLTESGSLQENDFNDAIHYFQTGTNADDSELSEMGDCFIPTLLLASVISQLNGNNDGGDRGGGEGGGEGNDIDYDSDDPFLPDWPPQGGVGGGVPDPLGPYVMTKWGQDERPFNKYTPNHYKAGCQSIALAQLLVSNRFSNTMEFNNYTCDWDDMEGVYNYQNYQQDSLHNGSIEGKEQVANLIVGLGSSSYLNMEYSETGSHPYAFMHLDMGIPLTNAMVSLGYVATRVYNLFSFTDSMKMKTYNMLRAGYPVLTLGSIGLFDKGHTWLIDGYRCVVGIDYSGDFYHINWGWFGNGDGYYNLGLFNTGNGVFSHPVYDDPNQLHPQSTYDFEMCFAIIDYSIDN